MTIETKYDLGQSLWLIHRPLTSWQVQIGNERIQKIVSTYKGNGKDGAIGCVLWGQAPRVHDEHELNKHYYPTREAAKEECDRRNGVANA